MTEEQLKIFIKEYSIPYYWDGEEVYIELYHFLLENFTDLLTSGYYDDGVTLPVNIHYDCIIVYMNHICDYYGIDMQNVFIKD